MKYIRNLALAFAVLFIAKYILDKNPESIIKDTTFRDIIISISQITGREEEINERNKKMNFVLENFDNGVLKPSLDRTLDELLRNNKYVKNVEYHVDNLDKTKILLHRKMNLSQK